MIDGSPAAVELERWLKVYDDAYFSSGDRVKAIEVADRRPGQIAKGGWGDAGEAMNFSNVKQGRLAEKLAQKASGRNPMSIVSFVGPCGCRKEDIAYNKHTCDLQEECAS